MSFPIFLQSTRESNMSSVASASKVSWSFKEHSSNDKDSVLRMNVFCLYIYRPAGPLCQGGGGRIRAVSFHRHCEKHS